MKENTTPWDLLLWPRVAALFCACQMTFTASQQNTSRYLSRSAFLSKSWKVTEFVYHKPHNLTMKKYDVYLPLKYNDGSQIEPEKLEEIEQQLISVFGSITVSPLSAPFQGTWRYGGVQFVDDIIRIEVITEGELTANHFFKRYKQQLKRTLRQFEILITVQDVERV